MGSASTLCEHFCQHEHLPIDLLEHEDWSQNGQNSFVRMFQFRKKKLVSGGRLTNLLLVVVEVEAWGGRGYPKTNQILNPKHTRLFAFL